MFGSCVVSVEVNEEKYLLRIEDHDLAFYGDLIEQVLNDSKEYILKVMHESATKAEEKCLL